MRPESYVGLVGKTHISHSAINAFKVMSMGQYEYFDDPRKIYESTRNIQSPHAPCRLIPSTILPQSSITGNGHIHQDAIIVRVIRAPILRLFSRRHSNHEINGRRMAQHYTTMNTDPCLSRCSAKPKSTLIHPTGWCDQPRHQALTGH